VPRHLGYLPWRQIRKNTSSQRFTLALKTLNLIADIQFRIITNEPELINFCLQFCNWLLKIQKIHVHITISQRLKHAAMIPD